MENLNYLQDLLDSNSQSSLDDNLVGNAEKTVSIYTPRNEHGSSIRHFDYKKELGPIHNEIIRLLSIGLTNSEVAMKMGVTNATVINVKYSHEGRMMLKLLGVERDKMTIILKDKVSQLGPIAADVIEDLLMDKETPQSVKARTALQILEMNGLSRSKDEGINAHLQDAIISQIVANANNSGLMIVHDSVAEDAEVVEENAQTD